MYVDNINIEKPSKNANELGYLYTEEIHIHKLFNVNIILNELSSFKRDIYIYICIYS